MHASDMTSRSVLSQPCQGEVSNDGVVKFIFKQPIGLLSIESALTIMSQNDWGKQLTKSAANPRGNIILADTHK